MEENATWFREIFAPGIQNFLLIYRDDRTIGKFNPGLPPTRGRRATDR